MKKLALMLAMVFTFSFLLTACGEKDNSTPDTNFPEGNEYFVEEISNCLIIYAFEQDETGALILNNTVEDISTDAMERFACAMVFYKTDYFTDEEMAIIPVDEDYSYRVVRGHIVKKIMHEVFACDDYVGENYSSENEGYLFAIDNAYVDYTTARLAVVIDEEARTMTALIAIYANGANGPELYGYVEMHYAIVTEAGKTFIRFVSSVESNGFLAEGDEAESTLPEGEESKPEEDTEGEVVDSGDVADESVPAESEEAETSEG